VAIHHASSGEMINIRPLNGELASAITKAQDIQSVHSDFQRTMYRKLRHRWRYVALCLPKLRFSGAQNSDSLRRFADPICDSLLP
jgi:hypothetical protein